MEIYTTPKIGTYKAKVRRFDGTYDEYSVKCEVIGETGSSYIIKPRVPINGHPAHDRMTVRKRNVTFAGMMRPVKREHDYTAAWWND